MSFSVAEKFVSINGEGRRAGQLAVFLRFTGCNLRCGYCDTTWANERDCPAEELSAEELLDYVRSTGVHNVTLTGGEPLLREGIGELLRLLSGEKELWVEIETNGSVPIAPFLDISNRPSFTMDYKLPSSGMEKAMCLANFSLLGAKDTVKFVCGSRSDLLRAGEIMEAFSLRERCRVYLSPVFGEIDPAEIVEFMKERRWNGVNLQLQLHKFIWPPEQRGV